jgi:hypothetical protein
MTRFGEGKNMTLGSQFVLGLLLLLTPWLVGFAAEQTTAWTAWITGGAIALVAAIGMAGYAYAMAWVNLVLGIWALLAPWILGFAASTGAMWSHVVLGALTALSAAAELWMEHQGPPRVHA